MSRYAWILLAVLAFAPGAALAGPDDGDGTQDDGRHCPHGVYSILHYWLPEYFEARSWFRRYDLDQYAPGPSPPVTPGYIYVRNRCPSMTPTPLSPYNDPERYYGRQIAPVPPAP